ncbi:hypothetical protein R1flu_008125 [Riccia fluitans]|uniref:Core-2/I-branching beta-1,6-N-acetylglucosaminyltransferase family protein n=1 Tax=Riccia fluitans TaxID=41844 RepID=A0ABD1YB14_9MARC
MPHDILWDHFFKGAKKDDYSVYIHARPGMVYSKKTTDCKAFYNRQIQNSISVEWGGASMVQAERLLLATALEDPLNERFIFLSDSCVPLYSFKYIYDYVKSSPKSFVDSFIDYTDERYDPRMAPHIKIDRWRKGSQMESVLNFTRFARKFTRGAGFRLRSQAKSYEDPLSKPHSGGGYVYRTPRLSL